jgi:hypothetical protein
VQIRKTALQSSASNIAGQSDESNNIQAKGTLREDDAKKGERYKFWIDTLSMNTFFFCVGAFNEMVVSGLSFKQSMKARLVGGLINTTTGGLYGKYSDWAQKKLNITEDTPILIRTVANTAIFAVQAVPINLTMYKIAGANNKHILIATTVGTAVCSALGEPYDIYKNWLRKKMGVKDSK